MEYKVFSQLLEFPWILLISFLSHISTVCVFLWGIHVKGCQICSSFQRTSSLFQLSSYIYICSFLHFLITVLRLGCCALFVCLFFASLTTKMHYYDVCETFDFLTYKLIVITLSPSDDFALFFISSILLQSHSPPEKVKDIADEVFCVNFTDDSLQASRKHASEYSISSLVNTTCSLTHIMAEENFDTTVPNRFYETLAKNDLLFQKNHIYRWKSDYHPQVCYSRRLSHRLTLPRFPLRRRWSELPLPTFITETEGNKSQEVNEKTSKGLSKSSSPDSYIRS